MIPLVTLRELLAYNYWARDRQLEGVRGAKSGTVSPSDGRPQTARLCAEELAQNRAH